MSDLRQLTSIQLIVIFISAMIGVGIILMPRDLANAVNSPDLWVSIIIGALLMCLITTLYVLLVTRYPGLTFFDMSKKITGRWIGTLINLFFIFHCLIVASYILRVTTAIIKNYLLDTTPLYVIIGSFLLVSLYLISNGPGDVVRFFQLYFPVMMFMFLILALLSIKDVDVQNLRPVLKSNLMTTVTQSKISFFSFIGIEFLMIFSPLIKTKKIKKLALSVWTSIIVTAVIYVIFHILTIGVLGIAELKEITFPTIEMAKSIEFQGFFFERFELIFIFGWLITVFTSFTTYTYGMILGIGKVTKPGWWCMAAAGLLIFSITLYPEGLTEVLDYSSHIQWVSAAAIIGFPGLLLLVSLVRRQTHDT
ncbi:GerAB/ArcD/ProY family transporter [Halobacillus litoralis]|uniref:GerAB/ArcD/ProY family transporter n=1 Tax=Halobacillus litoralis TaxID=45668 RepID=UPI00136C3C2A|nr:endospore germination permease [Halobacillus litoralis]MYL37913.1 endospore germination permease [Halobacillus litoralis]